MEDWFVEVWEGGGDKDYKPGHVLKFHSCQEAWAYVIANDIKNYCVYKGECVIDHT